jgi:chemotaxis regulatin CheY-phosphate phosphatase CheZ
MMENVVALQVRLKQEISELSSSIDGIIESFRELKMPLVETHEKVPQATNQLDKISEQTEAATHQMLDRIEQITIREDEVVQGLDELRVGLGSEIADEMVAKFDKLKESASSNLQDAYSIMDALQFQDITAQQMSHAASLLEEIQGRLIRIVGIVNGEGTENSTDLPSGKKQRIFDPHADLFDKKTNQEDIDSLFDQKK